MATSTVRSEDPRHLVRFLRHEAGMSSQAIAKAERVSLQTVEESIKHVERYRANSSSQQMDFAVRDMVVGIMPTAKQTMLGMLTAMRLEEIPDRLTGKMKVVRRPDKNTRLEGLRIVADLVGKMQPKAPMAEVNVSQNVQVANLSSAETPEERFRRLRRQQQEFNALPPEVAAVPRSIDSGAPEDEEGVDEEDEDEEGEEEDEDDKDQRP
jgi:hypothetical protein